MKRLYRKKLRFLSMVISSVLLLAAGFYFFIFFQYEPDKDMLGFPVPKHAKLMKENKGSKSYDWNPATEIHGIPFSYEWALKGEGWEKGGREGARVSYSKGSDRITLTSVDDWISISRIN
ncbi:hypothetical protein [Peribacillus sp. SCS-37]|uniref:hypothetical protein n=1 Tax=Paraperibacillus esterisolvens TaxID=3115296 RepID=UPI003905861D